MRTFDAIRLRPAGIDMLKETIREFRADHPFELSAALSFYTLLSLAPLVLVTVAVASLAFERGAVEARILTEVQSLIGDSGAKVVKSVLENAAGPAHGVIALIVGVGTLLAGAATVFVQLQDALNQIWDVEVKPNSHAIWSVVRHRLLSLAMVLGVGFLLLLSLLLSAALSALGEWAGTSLDGFPFVLRAIETVASVGVIALLLGLIFKLLPDARMRWSDVWFGGFVTSVLFTGGKYLIGLYLGHATLGSAYGAASSLVVLMVWVYYASVIVLFGAELTHVRSRRGSGRPDPKANAVAVKPRRAHRERVK